jgi:hypothetical protein
MPVADLEDYWMAAIPVAIDLPDWQARSPRRIKFQIQILRAGASANPSR